NSGTVNNEVNASIYLSGTSTINNSGTVNNVGIIDGYGVINSDGIINNNHQITGLFNITSSGSIINNGYISTFEMAITGGELSGNGDVYVGNGLVITEAGTLAPGNSTGIMHVFGDLTIDGTLAMEFDPLGFGLLHDRLYVSQNVFLSETSVLDVSFLSDDWFSLGNSFDLMLAETITGDFGNFYYDALFDNSLALEWGIFNDFGQDVLRLTVVSAVPLPAAAWLFISGLAGLIAAGKRRKHHTTH
ncbi:MAG: VPLPA-CTERM sorting domain-containing protein, partial [Gammaproteobacteria bacterium]|nr:VPLPA-CTERM sorting domain-containing protein [Gammaproteobacteria bacterium]